MPDVSSRLLPMQRLEWLFDEDSIELIDEVRSRPSADGEADRGLNVIGARGRVGGRPVAAYAQDQRISGGSVGQREADMIVTVLRHAREAQIPVVGFIESGGARLQDGAGALDGFGRIFFENVALSGRSPQISVITGTSAGGGCYSPALTDFVVMAESASMFLTGPKIVKVALGETVSTEDLGGPGVHERNGVCDFVARGDGAAAELVRELLSYLPAIAGEAAPAFEPEPPHGDGDPAGALPERSRAFYDVRDVIRRLGDGGRFLEVAPRWARNMVVGFTRIDGQAVGVIANQAAYLGGIIDVDASQKGAKFVRTCDRYGIPMMVLVDTPGFMPGTKQEGLGVIRHGAELVRAFAGSTAPRATVILRKAFGGAFITMNSKGLGADAHFSWPGAEIGVMSATGAVEIIHRRELASAPEDPELAERLAQSYAERHLTAYAALELGAIDEVIHPAQTRDRIAEALFGGWSADADVKVRRFERQLSFD
jgi:acetyl-CoA carboxylase carboxyltransferase component